MLNQKRQKVTLNLDNGKTREVDATVYGPFAVHPYREGCDDPRDLWTVTHIASGLSVANAWDHGKALRAVEQFAELPVDWGNCKGVEDRKKWPADVLQRACDIRDEAERDE